jgi:hypothetical protein
MRVSGCPALRFVQDAADVAEGAALEEQYPPPCHR